MTENDLNDYLTRLGEFVREVKEVGDDEQHREEAAVFKRPGSGKIFAIAHVGSNPLRIEVGIDEKLAKLLAEKYESVMPSRLMSPKNWIEIIVSGQLADDEVLDLVRLSHDMAADEAESGGAK